MPSIICTCKTIIDYGYIPCNEEWLIISDAKFDKFSGMIDTGNIYRSMDHLLKCPTCGNLWVFWNGFQNAPTGYGILSEPTK